MAWMFVPSQNLYVEFLTLSVTVLGGEAFGCDWVIGSEM